MTFQTKITIIALIIFIISMGTIGVMLNAAGRNIKYPPEISLCPDYWEVKAQTNDSGEILHDPKHICITNQDLGDKADQGNVGTFLDKQMDFSPSIYQGPSGHAEKCLWANSQNIFWSGITDMGACQKLRPTSDSSEFQ
jgi:hypothetical protein